MKEKKKKLGKGIENLVISTRGFKNIQIFSICKKRDIFERHIRESENIQDLQENSNIKMPDIDI